MSARFFGQRGLDDLCELRSYCAAVEGDWFGLQMLGSPEQILDGQTV